jgi:transglutaminase-like putative cysteine protease
VTATARTVADRPSATSRAGLLRLVGAVVLCLPALLGFTAAFGTPRALVTAVAALLLGAAAGWVSAVRRLSAPTTAALVVVVGAVAAGPLALPGTTAGGVLPTAETFRQLVPGVVRCWRDLVTATAPTGVVAELLLVPYLTALLGGLLAVVLALRTGRPGAAVVPAGAVLVVSVLVGTDSPVSPLVQGAVLAVLAVGWIAVTTAAWSRPDVVRAVAGGVLLAVAAGAATVAAPAVTASGADRFVLRDRVEPPFDVRAYQSPLNGFRRYVKDEHDTPLFTVSGVAPGTRLRLATMDAYDGTVWNVAGSAGDATSSGTFRRLPLDPGSAAAVTVHVQVSGLTGVWLPDVGTLRSVAFTGPRAAALGDGLRYNAATGTALVPDGLQPGDGYTVRADVVPEPGGGQLARAQAAALVQPQPQQVPAVLTSTAADAAGPAKTAYARAQAIADTLRTTGYFSDGLADQATSRAGHGSGRLADLLGSKIWIGDGEQYAAAAGLMGRQLGLPTRVVMGFTVPAGGPQGAVVTGQQVTAWIEVAFQGAGWVPFDVTPAASRVPPQQAPQPAPKPKPSTQQPPPPVEQPPPSLPATGNDQGKQQQDRPGGLPGWVGAVLTVAAWVGGPVLLLALLAGLVVGLKLRRRRRRRRTGAAHQRVAAGWWEVLDAHRDHGAALPRTATRREVAGALGRPLPHELALRADSAVFSGATVTDDEAAVFWDLVDQELADLSAGGLKTRWRARLSLRSLRRRTP